MTNPIVRIPKDLLSAIDKVAGDRGVRASVLIGQAIRFYLAATEPALVAAAITEAIKPLAADLRHIKYVLDKQTATADPAPSRPASPSASSDAERRNLLLEIQEQKRRAALDRMSQKSHSNSPIEGNHS